MSVYLPWSPFSVFTLKVCVCQIYYVSVCLLRHYQWLAGVCVCAVQWMVHQLILHEGRVYEEPRCAVVQLFVSTTLIPNSLDSVSNIKPETIQNQQIFTEMNLMSSNSKHTDFVLLSGEFKSERTFSWIDVSHRVTVSLESRLLLQLCPSGVWRNSLSVLSIWSFAIYFIDLLVLEVRCWCSY